MIDFIKTHALGNDFILVGARAVPESRYQALAEAICHRYFGIGADGLIFWDQKSDVFDLRIFNRDGSEAEVSGNGLRCAAAYFIESKRWPQNQIQLRTVSGLYRLVRVGTEYEADMGVPALRPDEVPFVPDKPMDRVVDYPFQVNGETVRISLCATGNPHCSLFVDELNDAMIERLGSRLERAPAFPNRTNVEFIKVLSRSEVEVAFWERGVGFSYASGTGSCGAVVACILNGKTERRVTVRTKAGKLTVEWPENGRLKLTSTATIVAEGHYYGTL
jgi:diaminopimelate epimerase